MRRDLALMLAGAAGCGQLVEDSFAFESITIESPGDGARVLGRDVFPVEVAVDCADVRFVDVKFDDWTAGSWDVGDPETAGCSGRPGTRCVPVASQVPVQRTSFWPARMQAFLGCGSHAGEVSSEVLTLYVAPFDDLAVVPARVSSLLAAPSGAMIALSEEGLHRVDGSVRGLTNHAPSPRAFAAGGDIYYYAPCVGLRCGGDAADLFRVDAATLVPRDDSTWIGCAPSAIVPAGDQLVVALAGCQTPRVAWLARDLGELGQTAVDVRLTDAAGRRGDEVVVLGWRGDELVIVAAGAAPAVTTRATGVTGSLAALSDDAARAAVLDATGKLSIIDASTAAVVTRYELPPHPPGDVVALAFAPGAHRVLVAYRDGARLIDESAQRLLAPPADDDGAPLTVRFAAPVDAGRVLMIADPDTSEPARRLVTVTDGATSAFRHWVGADWLLSAAPGRGATGQLHLAFDTHHGPVVVTATAAAAPAR